MAETTGKLKAAQRVVERVVELALMWVDELMAWLWAFYLVGLLDLEKVA